MFKKIIASVTAIALGIGMLSACGPNASSTSGTGSASSSSAAEKSQQAESESQAPSGGDEGSDKPTEKGEPIKLNFYSTIKGYEGAKAKEAQEAVQEKIWEDLGINCELNIITSDSYNPDQLAVKIAAGELDAISTNMGLTNWQVFIDKGMLLPLDDMLETEGKNFLDQIDQKMWDAYRSADGNTYLIPIPSSAPFYCSTWLRMDLFRKYGINEVPTTVSELIDGIRVVCENEPDMVGMAAGHVSWITNSGPMNYHPVDAEGNQTLTNAAGDAMIPGIFCTNTWTGMYWEDEGFRKNLQRFADLYADGIIDPQLFTTTFDHADELVASNRVVCLGAPHGFQTTADQKAGLYPDYPVADDEKQEWVFITNLVNDINGAPTTWRYEYETSLMIGLVSTTKYPDEVMKILNWVIESDENFALADWGIEGVHYTYNDDGTVNFLLDESGERLVPNALGGMILNLRPETHDRLVYHNYGTEWLKIYEGPPTSLTWAHCDGFINYQYEKVDGSTITDLETIAEEALVDIVTGKIGVDEGLDKMAQRMDDAGYQDYYEERNAQYCKGMGIQ